MGAGETHGSRPGRRSPRGRTRLFGKPGRRLVKIHRLSSHLPESFFERIHAYHGLKPQAAWCTGHDVGPEAGISSAALATRTVVAVARHLFANKPLVYFGVFSFTNVIVSDSNDGYTKPARETLVEKLGASKSKSSFLQGSAEKSTVQSRPTDLITACEMIPWTDTAAAVEEPNILGSKEAQRTWLKFFVESTKRTVGHGYFYDHAYETINSGDESIELLETKWEVVNRIYANTGESLDAFHINDLIRGSKVKEVEEKTWEESDEEWSDEQGVDWFKGYFATWVPRIRETETQSLWDELELDMNGERSG
ncbi:putative Methyltransferase type 11 domain-containing protein [Seiridium unicorne]|uniref:Methyltransferase type 11 domain-containing protein n=1 Tax=Seiridium unicorne TaxID=138068 RepID=A0ABR2VBU9_9PEZI